MSRQWLCMQSRDEMAVFWRKLQTAVLQRGGSQDDLSLFSRRESKACFNLLASHVLAMAEVLRGVVYVEQRFDSPEAVIAAGNFIVQDIVQLWARDVAAAGAIAVAAELYLYTPPAAIDNSVLTVIEHNGFRAATLAELVAWCMCMIKTPPKQFIAALADIYRGRNGCIFVPCAGIEDGRLVQWWDHYGAVCRAPYTLLVACRE